MSKELVRRHSAIADLAVVEPESEKTTINISQKSDRMELDSQPQPTHAHQTDEPTSDFEEFAFPPPPPPPGFEDIQEEDEDRRSTPTLASKSVEAHQQAPHQPTSPESDSQVTSVTNCSELLATTTGNTFSSLSSNTGTGGELTGNVEPDDSDVVINLDAVAATSSAAGCFYSTQLLQGGTLLMTGGYGLDFDDDAVLGSGASGSVTGTAQDDEDEEVYEDEDITGSDVYVERNTLGGMKGKITPDRGFYNDNVADFAVAEGSSQDEEERAKYDYEFETEEDDGDDFMAEDRQALHNATMASFYSRDSFKLERPSDLDFNRPSTSGYGAKKKLHISSTGSTVLNKAKIPPSIAEISETSSISDRESSSGTSESRNASVEKDNVVKSGTYYENSKSLPENLYRTVNYDVDSNVISNHEDDEDENDSPVYEYRDSSRTRSYSNTSNGDRSSDKGRLVRTKSSTLGQYEISTLSPRNSANKNDYMPTNCTASSLQNKATFSYSGGNVSVYQHALGAPLSSRGQNSSYQYSSVSSDIDSMLSASTNADTRSDLTPVQDACSSDPSTAVDVSSTNTVIEKEHKEERSDYEDDSNDEHKDDGDSSHSRKANTDPMDFNDYDDKDASELERRRAAQTKRWHSWDSNGNFTPPLSNDQQHLAKQPPVPAHAPLTRLSGVGSMKNRAARIMGKRNESFDEKFSKEIFEQLNISEEKLNFRVPPRSASELLNTTQYGNVQNDQAFQAPLPADSNSSLSSLKFMNATQHSLDMSDNTLSQSKREDIPLLLSTASGESIVQPAGVSSSFRDALRHKIPPMAIDTSATASMSEATNTSGLDSNKMNRHRITQQHYVDHHQRAHRNHSKAAGSLRSTPKNMYNIMSNSHSQQGAPFSGPFSLPSPGRASHISGGSGSSCRNSHGRSSPLPSSLSDASLSPDAVLDDSTTSGSFMLDDASPGYTDSLVSYHSEGNRFPRADSAEEGVTGMSSTGSAETESLNYYDSDPYKKQNRSIGAYNNLTQYKPKVVMNTHSLPCINYTVKQVGGTTPDQLRAKFEQRQARGTKQTRNRSSHHRTGNIVAY